MTEVRKLSLSSGPLASLGRIAVDDGEPEQGANCRVCDIASYSHTSIGDVADDFTIGLRQPHDCDEIPRRVPPPVARTAPDAFPHLDRTQHPFVGRDRKEKTATRRHQDRECVASSSIAGPAKSQSRTPTLPKAIDARQRRQGFQTPIIRVARDPPKKGSRTPISWVSPVYAWCSCVRKRDRSERL